MTVESVKSSATVDAWVTTTGECLILKFPNALLIIQISFLSVLLS
jgi:hypothetical protein